MKAQLEISRAVVRTVWATPRCGSLHEAIWDRNERPSMLWRKRLARHVRECAECSVHQRESVPVEILLAGTALVPLPVTGIHLADHVWLSSPRQTPAAADQAPLDASPKPSRRRSRAGRSGLPAGRSSRRSRSPPCARPG